MMRLERAAGTNQRPRREVARCLFAAAVVLVALALAGCAHEKAYKRGTRLSEQGQYERAVEELETAIALAEEKNNEKAATRYREKLEEVKRSACQFYYREAESGFGRADLGAARTFIEKSLRYCPQEQPYQAFRTRVLEAIAKAEQVRTDALSLADQRQWKAAVQRMQEALGMYRTMPGGDGDLKRIRERAHQYYLARARDRLRENDLDGAESEAKAALAYRDGSREAQGVLESVQNRREATGLIARGRDLLDRGAHEEALRLLEQAHRLHPSHSELPELLGQARRAVCDGWIDQGRQAMETNDYATALVLFQKSHGLLEGYAGVNGLMSDARSRLADIHLEMSRQFQRNGTDGCAVLHAAVALGYRSNDFEARRQLGQCAGQVREDVSYTVAFVGFRARPQQQTIADMLGSAALTHLTHTRPPNVKLVERTDLHTLVDTQNLNLTGLLDPQSRKLISTLEGIDALIVGEILDHRVTTETRQTGHGRSTYQDGFRAEPNPDYVQAATEVDAALEALERARRRLAEAEARLARYGSADPDDPAAQARQRKAKADVAEAKQRLVNAATDVGAAEFRLSATPPEVLVPNTVEHEYPIQTVTWTAKVGCLLKMLDTTTGELILAETVEGRQAQSDDMVAADPARNVPEDPLELPNDATLLEGAANAAIEKLKRSLNAACEKHGHRFVIRMRQAEAAGDMVGAVDNGIKYLFAYPAGDDHTNKAVSLVRTYLRREDDLVNIRELLRTHCHVLLK